MPKFPMVGRSDGQAPPLELPDPPEGKKYTALEVLRRGGVTYDEKRSTIAVNGKTVSADCPVVEGDRILVNEGIEGG